MVELSIPEKLRHPDLVEDANFAIENRIAGLGAFDKETFNNIKFDSSPEHYDECMRNFKHLLAAYDLNFIDRKKAKLLCVDIVEEPKKIHVKDMLNKKEWIQVLTSRVSQKKLPNGTTSTEERCMLILKRYLIIRRLKKKGVYLGKDIELDRTVVIKCLKRESQSREEQNEWAKRLQREAEVLSMLEHPNIVKILDCGKERENFYLVEQFIQGDNFETLLLKRKVGTLYQLIENLITVSQALGSLEKNGLIHRDIKPPNLMLSEHGIPFLIDFGLAKDPKGSLDVTLQDVIVGTPEYMSPEQTHDLPLDCRSDIFSFGGTLYFMITGRSPFKGNEPHEIIGNIRKANFELPSKTMKGFPKELDHFLLKAMAKNPNDRYRSFTEVTSVLKSFCRRFVGADINLPITKRRKLFYFF